MRIIRPATQAQLDALPRIDKDDPEAGPNLDALLKCRLVSAFVLERQLEYFGVHVFPYIHMSNAGPLFMVGRDTIREWFRWATDARFLHQSQAPARRTPGKWNVRKLDQHDAPLTLAESLLVEALVAHDTSHPAVLLLLHSTHAAWSQKKRSMKGFEDWWAALQVAADRPTAEVLKSDERRAARLNIRTLADIEALVTPEGRALYDERQAQRAEEREASNAWFAGIGEKNTDAWTIIRERLDWADCTEETLLDWTSEALNRLASANERNWASGDGRGADARAVAVRDSLTWRIREKFKFAPDLAAALHALRVSALTRAERNIRDRLGWGTVSADQLVEKAQETVLRLVSAPDDLAADIRRTLIDAIPRRYPHDASAVAEALIILKGAA
ncbi:hypothetical protein ASE56_10530 [Microbacterium sp. Leaf203]|nr:hypothetical protein ASE56_10530 [Microbacterium sp. Leaf203]